MLSVDYDAPLSEAGDMTLKWVKVRDMLRSKVKGQIQGKVLPSAICSSLIAIFNETRICFLVSYSIRGLEIKQILHLKLHRASYFHCLAVNYHFFHFFCISCQSSHEVNVLFLVLHDDRKLIN